MLLVMFASARDVSSQQTVGALENTAEAWNGYTLFTPNTSKFTYLVNNCGELVNTWTSNFNPGLSAVLSEDGELIRAARISTSIFNAGGSGGRLEKFDWDGNLIWSYDYSSDDFHQHHDFELLPNGNILILAWERKTDSEAIIFGRDPATIDDQLWPEQIVEVEPIGSDQINIVWEWHLWDHLIQDFDPSRANYGVVADHPELVDINFALTGGGGGVGGAADWVHLNAIDYNPELDQIVVSSRHLDEIWVIDHSTTTGEAAGHSGGNSGMGGDILYRWGNPQAYDRGTESDRKLFGPHDIQWVEAGYPGEGNLLIYNNGQGRPGVQYSSVEEWAPPFNPGTGSYNIDVSAPFAPAEPDWIYDGDQTLYSSNISGTQRLPNGNTMMIVGRDGAIHEVNFDGERQWYYVNPIGIGGPTAQGGIPVANDLFRARKYAPDFPGFAGKDLTPGDPLEIGDLPWMCQIYENPVGLEETETPDNLQFNVLFDGSGIAIIPALDQHLPYRWEVFDATGRLISRGLSRQSSRIGLGSLRGTVFVKIISEELPQGFESHPGVLTGF